MFPVNVLKHKRCNTDAITGPFEVPECIVIKSVATLLVKLRVCPFTAPEIAENSPAKNRTGGKLQQQFPMCLLEQLLMGTGNRMYTDSVHQTPALKNNREIKKAYNFLISLVWLIGIGLQWDLGES